MVRSPPTPAFYGGTATAALPPPPSDVAPSRRSRLTLPRLPAYVQPLPLSSSHSPASNQEISATTEIGRRKSTLLLSLPFLLPSLASPATEASVSSRPELEPYNDSAEGFTLLRPSSWSQVEKAGATALFQEEGRGSNNIGVVVSPVRLASLKDFGTPEFVVSKLIQAERRKESTKEAEVVSVSERTGHGGLPIYEFEYTVDSTRGGLKRIFSAAFVASKKLYLLNIACSDSPENPLDSQMRMVLEQVLHSFDAIDA